MSSQFRVAPGHLINANRKSIELIPGDGKEWLDSLADNPHAPFLLVDGNLGVPEKVLFKLYILVVKDMNVNAVVQDTQTADKARKMTAVILLSNSGHQTALNIRKRLLLHSFIDAQDELAFIEIMFMVKQIAKVSTLWHHRRWLLCYQLASGRVKNPTNLDEEFVKIALPVELIQKEFAVASAAATVYPRNYHAWLHRTLCMHCALEQAPLSDRHMDLLIEERSFMMKWIDLNVSDYSAVHYLVNLNLGVLALQRLQHGDKQQLAMELRNHAIDLVDRYPIHETLWLYVRLTEDLENGQAASDHFRTKVASRLEKYDPCSPDQTKENSPYFHYATRYILWRNHQVRA